MAPRAQLALFAACFWGDAPLVTALRSVEGELAAVHAEEAVGFQPLKAWAAAAAVGYRPGAAPPAAGVAAPPAYPSVAGVAGAGAPLYMAEDKGEKSEEKKAPEEDVKVDWGNSPAFFASPSDPTPQAAEPDVPRIDIEAMEEAMQEVKAKAPPPPAAAPAAGTGLKAVPGDSTVPKIKKDAMQEVDPKGIEANKPPTPPPGKPWDKDPRGRIGIADPNVAKMKREQMLEINTKGFQANKPPTPPPGKVWDKDSRARLAIGDPNVAKMKREQMLEVNAAGIKANRPPTPPPGKVWDKDSRARIAIGDPNVAKMKREQMLEVTPSRTNLPRKEIEGPEFRIWDKDNRYIVNKGDKQGPKWYFPQDEAMATLSSKITKV